MLAQNLIGKSKDVKLDPFIINAVPAPPKINDDKEEVKKDGIDIDVPGKGDPSKDVIKEVIKEDIKIDVVIDDPKKDGIKNGPGIGKVIKDDLKIIDKKDPAHRDVPGKGDP